MLKTLIAFTFMFFTALPVSQEELLINLRKQIGALAGKGDIPALVNLADSLENAAFHSLKDTAYLAELYYYTGVCNLLAEKSEKALTGFNNCIKAKESADIIDENLAKALYNASVSCYMMGDFTQSISFARDCEAVAIKIFGEVDGNVADTYTLLAGASIENRDYEGFVGYALKALNLLAKNPSALEGKNLVALYSTIGVGYAKMDDFAKAKLYLEKAGNIFNQSGIPVDPNYINLINSLAYTYGSLGDTLKEEVYFAKGIELAVKSASLLAFNLINSYAIKIGNSGNIPKGAAILSNVLREAEKVYGRDSKTYMDVLDYCAGYSVQFNYTIDIALKQYEKLLKYTSEHPRDIPLKTSVMLGYSRALYLSGSEKEALDFINRMLPGNGENLKGEKNQKPVPENLSADKSSVKMLLLKHEILITLYRKTADKEILADAAGTSEKIVELIEKIRLNISEEESRLVLGNRFRDSYITAISDFEKCYRITGDYRYLEKAFEYAERSKVAGLLAATRQMKAAEFHIPVHLAEREKLLQRDIGFYNSRLALENDKEKPDQSLISSWTGSLLSSIAARDSLVQTFEKDYPGYYKLKYSSGVPLMNEIPSITGRNYNYISYVVSDSALYVFLVNRKYKELLTVNTDTSFLTGIMHFRELLSDNTQSADARKKFELYRQTGHKLYTTLIEPLEKYFKGNNLLISSDNILSYLPFETFLYSDESKGDLLYRELDYLMNKYNISYSYSATFMQETSSGRDAGGNRLVAFAPSYPDRLNLDSLIASRQPDNLVSDLPFARQEAEFVADLAGGTLYLNNAATESLYKSEASAFNIIHLAMHAVVNDRNPMNSAMIFSRQDSSSDDGTLYTYEVYGIPLRARMVVLSSCNTGTGALYSGEGLLSLARGFLYSGSQSVVMSLWKIEDRSGTEIVKRFYRNLKSGMSKSKALKKSRSEYLKTANQLRSHPYFWSTLVVFGDNTPLYFPWKKAVTISLALFIPVLILILYFRKRRYS